MLLFHLSFPLRNEVTTTIPLVNFTIKDIQELSKQALLYQERVHLVQLITGGAAPRWSQVAQMLPE
jgi:ethanolamine utilization cobalamin adenosyltransferase